MKALRNTTLDDISAVVGFSATLRLAAWFGSRDSNMYVPEVVDEGQLLVKLIGISAAKKLSETWGGEHVSVPMLTEYEVSKRLGSIAKLFEREFTSREIGVLLNISERRVQQICRELEQAEMIDVVVPKKRPVESSKENAGVSGAKVATRNWAGMTE